MGSCTFKKQKTDNRPRGIPLIRSKYSTRLPNIFYLDRQKMRMKSLVNYRLKSKKFTHKIKMREDSAISFLSRNRLMFGGGTTSTGCLSSEVYLLDNSQNTLTCMVDMPLMAKEGAFYEIGDMFYYAGGLRMPETEHSKLREIPLPLMRFNSSINNWEILKHTRQSSLVVQSVIHGTLKDTIEEPGFSNSACEEISPESLLYSGTFATENKLCFVGGYLINENQTLEPNTHVYSLRIRDSFVFAKENIQIDTPILKPICSYNGNNVAIVGGFDLDWNPLCSVYNINMKNKQFFRELPSIPSPLKENYPIQYDQNFMVYSFPTFFVLYNNEWKELLVEYIPKHNGYDKIVVEDKRDVKKPNVIEMNIGLKVPYKKRTMTQSMNSSKRSIGSFKFSLSKIRFKDTLTGKSFIESSPSKIDAGSYEELDQEKINSTPLEIHKNTSYKRGDFLENKFFPRFEEINYKQPQLAEKRKSNGVVESDDEEVTERRSFSSIVLDENSAFSKQKYSEYIRPSKELKRINVGSELSIAELVVKNESADKECQTYLF